MKKKTCPCRSSARIQEYIQALPASIKCQVGNVKVQDPSELSDQGEVSKPKPAAVLPVQVKGESPEQFTLFFAVQ